MSRGKRPHARQQGTPDPRAKRPKISLPPPDAKGRIPKPPQSVVDEIVRYEQRRLGRPICGAWHPRKGWVCRKWPLRGRNRCELDGGKTPTGVESPHFKVGIFSQAFDGNAAASYHALLQDEKLLNMRHHVAAATMLSVETLQEMNRGVPPRELWEECRRLRLRILAARDPAQGMQLMQQLLQVIDDGADQMAKREEFMKTQDHIRRLADTERRHADKERRSMSYEAWVVNTAILVEAIKLFFPPEPVAQFRHWIQQNIMGLPKGADLTVDLDNAETPDMEG